MAAKDSSLEEVYLLSNLKEANEEADLIKKVENHDEFNIKDANQSREEEESLEIIEKKFDHDQLNEEQDHEWHKEECHLYEKDSNGSDVPKEEDFDISKDSDFSKEEEIKYSQLLDEDVSEQSLTKLDESFGTKEIDCSITEDLNLSKETSGSLIIDGESDNLNESDLLRDEESDKLKKEETDPSKVEKSDSSNSLANALEQANLLDLYHSQEEVDLSNKKRKADQLEESVDECDAKITDECEKRSGEEIQQELQVINARFQEAHTETRILTHIKSEYDKQMTIDVINPTTDIVECDKRSIYIGNVDYGATQEELNNHFYACGPIMRTSIIYNRLTGHPKGFAYMELSSPVFVRIAMSLDGSFFRNRQLKVMPKRTNRPGLCQTDRFPQSRGHGYGRDENYGGLVIRHRHEQRRASYTEIKFSPY